MYKDAQILLPVRGVKTGGKGMGIGIEGHGVTAIHVLETERHNDVIREILINAVFLYGYARSTIPKPWGFFPPSPQS